MSMKSQVGSRCHRGLCDWDRAAVVEERDRGALDR